MDILNLRETTQQIKVNNSEKNRLEDSSENILLDINKYENTIILLQTNISNIFNKINHKNNEIKNLSINFKTSIFKKIMEFVSFGIINYKQKHLENLNDIENKIKELQNSIIPEEDTIEKEEIIIKNLQLKNELIFQQITQTQSNIIKLENQFNEKLELFKNKLVSFQTKIISLSKERYINDYTRRELSNELNNITHKQEEFITHQNIEIGSSVTYDHKFQENKK
jgi:chromosome segregation ATPase